MLKMKLKQRLHSMRYFIKMCMVGSVGMVLQFVIFNLLRHVMLPTYANTIAIECAIISNFLLNNAYSFKDKKISRQTHGYRQLFKKAIQFNLASLFSMLIQIIIMSLGVHLFGRGFWVENLCLFVGIGLASLTNYFAYSRLIWKHKKL